MLDVTDTGRLQRWMAERDDRQPVDMVVANAGIAGGPGVDAARIMAVNVVGLVATVEALLPRMRRRGEGRLVLISSLASFFASPTGPAYAASKIAVRRYGEGIAPRLAREGIKVSVVCPGFVDTPLTRQNRFKMPMLIDADQAAAIIDRGLASGQARIAFPLPMYLMARLTGMLPASMRDAFLMRQPAKE